MTIKTALCIVGIAQNADDKLDALIDLAAGADWHLSILVLGIAPAPPIYSYGTAPQDLWVADLAAKRAQAERRSDGIRQRVQDVGLSADISVRVCDHVQADDAVGERAQFADVTLIPNSGAGDETVRSRSVYGALYKSARPILLLPDPVPQSFQPRNIMIGWDSGLPATRAIGHAIGLLRAADLVSIVIIDPIATQHGDGPEPGADLASYLARHGVRVEINQIPSGNLPVADVLRRNALDENADLLVMGAFGRSRLRQVVFGGTTTAVLTSPPLPVWMAH